MNPRLLVACSIILGGCFDVRPLDRAFGPDAAPPVADGAAPAPTPDDGPACAAIDKSCDGVDDDCDGRYDEDFGEADACGIGQCRDTSTAARCVSGFPIDCLPGPSTPEVCDGVDNDCDGRTDEGLTQGCGTSLGRCTRGEQRCVDGAWSPCDGVAPTEETCDGRDEDCDGDIDEALTRDCDGEGLCGLGIEQCRRGRWSGCDAGMADEACNGIDDDCDGAVDEVPDRDCGQDVGLCETGRQACVDGAWGACEGGVGPAPIETCDGLDEDCDGAVDEGEGPCGACTLVGRPVCPVGLDPCPAPAPLSLCISEVGLVEGDAGDALGRFVVAAGDIDNDGTGDFFAAGHRSLVGISGDDGSRSWRRGLQADTVGALAAADLTDNGRREAVVGFVDRPEGEVAVHDAGGAGRDSIVGTPVAPIGSAVAGLDGANMVAAGSPEARGGEGAVRLFEFQGRDTLVMRFDITLGGSEALGRVVALSRDGGGRPLMVTTRGPDDDREVVVIGDAFTDIGPMPVDAAISGPGVGERLAIGSAVDGRPETIVAANAAQPWVHLVDAEAVDGPRVAIRLPVDAVADDVALLPAGRDAAGRETRPLVLILTGSVLRLAEVDPSGSAAIVDYPVPQLELGGRGGDGRIAGSVGPDGARRVAIGAPGGALQRGRVLVLRIE